MRKQWWLLCVSIFLNGLSTAAATVIRIEVKQDKAIEQQGIVLNDRQLTLTRNSNFFCGSSDHGELGKFVAKVETQHELAATMEKLNLFHPKVSRGSPASPHDFQFYLNATNVTDDLVLRDLIHHIVVSECHAENWVREDTVHYEFVRGKAKPRIRISRNGLQNSFKEVDAKDAGCRFDGDFLVCEVPGYGRLRLRREP